MNTTNISRKYIPQEGDVGYICGAEDVRRCV
jgi:hypothetical protein